MGRWSHTQEAMGAYRQSAKKVFVLDIRKNCTCIIWWLPILDRSILWEEILIWEVYWSYYENSTWLHCTGDDWSDKELFFSNWFNSYKLINVLTSHGISATGTVNVDRVGNAPMISKKELGRKDRETIVSCQETKTGICITQWLDNGPVAVISNIYGITKGDQVKRWSKKTKSYVYMTRPKCVERYSKHMGGIYQLDSLVAVYRINIRGKKWYWPHFINTIAILKSAVYFVYKKANPDNRVDELAFVRSFVCFYLQRSAAALDRPSLVYPRKKSWKGGNDVSEEIRTSFTHFIQKSGTQKRYRVCPKTTRTVCEVCNVGLCLEPCFKQYHTSAAH